MFSFRRLILLAVPMRIAMDRFAALGFMVLAIAIMMIARNQTDGLSHLRSTAMTVLAPVMQVMAGPVHMANATLDNLYDMATLRAQFVQQNNELQTLRDWHETALRLEAENKALRDLLQMKQDAELIYFTGRVIGDPSSVYVHSILIATNGQAVKRGMAALSGQGLIGRVIDVDPSQSFARVLLITDMSSRVPVLLESSRQRAILTGDNSDTPILTHLPSAFTTAPGDRVLTSGFDGVFPPGLPIGRVTRIDTDGPRIQPLSNLERLEIIRLVDYGTITNPVMGHNSDTRSTLPNRPAK